MQLGDEGVNLGVDHNQLGKGLGGLLPHNLGKEEKRKLGRCQKKQEKEGETRKEKGKKERKKNLGGIVEGLDEGALKLRNELLQLGLDLVKQQSGLQDEK